MSRSKVESSVVLRMLGDFDSFISKHSEQMKQPSLSGNVIRHLDFEESLFGERSSTDVTFSCGSSAGSPVVTALSLTKERKKKLKKNHFFLDELNSEICQS